ncbi:hypothetical protein ACQEU3_43720 [Spirillospora sp. CA-253888]
MAVWEHDDKLYEVTSFYNPVDAWCYELVGLTGAPGTGPYLAVVIPDATPDEDSFTPKQAEHVEVMLADGQTPWPILNRLMDLVR